MLFKEKYEFITELCLVAMLLSIHFFLAFTSLVQESPTFDETVHVTGGVSYWKMDDYRINPENGNFPQRWSTLPLLCDKNLKPPVFTKSASIESIEWLTAYDFLYKAGNNPNRIFMLGKTMIVLLSLLLGLLVYFWSKKIFGIEGAALSLLLYAFCPTVLAHSRLVTSDIAAALGFIASAWAIWYMLEKITVPRLLLASLCLSMLFLSKMSAFMIIPMYMIMIAVRLKTCPELEVRIPGRMMKLRSQAGQLLAFLSAVLVNALVIAFFIWMSFGFRYSMLDGDPGMRQNMEKNWQDILSDTGMPGKVIDFTRQHRLLPEAYLFGFQFVLKKSQFRYAYLNGECRLTGWWYYFPYACLVKTPIPVMGLLALIMFLGIRRLRNLPSEAIIEKIYPLIPLVILICVYGVFAVASSMNIGHRHVLVLYPAAYILAGAGWLLLKKAADIARFTAIFFVIWLLAESMSIWPHYLAYFNQLAGGPSNGYRHMIDSSLDWGQDLKGLGKWLKKNNLPDQKKANVYVSYFGIACIDYYAPGVRKLPCYYGQEDDVPIQLGGGVYCISATMLPLIYMPELLNIGDLNSGLLDENLYNEVESDVRQMFAAMADSEKFKEFVKVKGSDFVVSRYRLYHILRFAKLARYLETRKPDDNIGYSILIYKLTDEEVANALKEKL
ncbi:MAG: glycosyltransferase family 39 protein [Victivallales bacterium]